MSTGNIIEGVIDPGHAASTPGKRAGTFLEYLSNRNIAVKLKRLLDSTRRFNITYSVPLADTRDHSLTERSLVARNRKAHFLVSLHSNAHNDEGVNGTETFIHPNTVASIPFATMIHNNLVSALGTRNRGLKTADFGILRGTYQYMLSCLTEGEFFTNPKARSWMLTSDYEDKYANGVFMGLCQFYKVSIHENKPVPAPPKVQPGTEGTQLIRVKAANLWVYNSANWNDRAFTVQKDEVFTIDRTLTVEGATMHQLKSGLYITGNKSFVELVGKVEKVPAKPAPKLLRITTPSLWTYNSKNWNDRYKAYKEGEVFTIAEGPVTHDGGKMYKLKSGKWITANSKYVTIV